MNILILSWRGPKHPQAGGAEISTHEHAKGWIKAGHDVTLFTSAFIGCKREEIIDGIKIIRSGRQMFGVHWEAFKWYLFGKHPRFDLVIDQFHGIPFFTPLYVRAKKLAFIHEVAKEIWKLNSWPRPFNMLAAVIGEIFEPLVFKLYRKVPFMTVSNSTRDDLVKWGIPKDRIKVIHNGVRISKFVKLPSKEKQNTAIFLGSISKDKGIEDALKIFALLQHKEDWQFWVVGKSDLRYLKFLKEMSKQSGIDRKIKFWGFVSEIKKFELLAKAHILINPSVREGWGLVVIEAAAMGTPTVGYNVAGLRNSILNNKTGIICSENTIQSLSDNIIKLIGDKKKYKQLCQNAISWNKNFSWEKSANLSLKLINNV